MDNQACGTSGEWQRNETLITRRELFLHLQTKGYLALAQSQCVSCLIDYVINKIPENFRQKLNKQELQKNIKSLVTNIFRRYRQCHRIVQLLFKKHRVWFDEQFNIPFHSQVIESTNKMRGRPRKLFKESSKRTQNRNVSELVSHEDHQQLLVATQKSLRLHGKRLASRVVEIASSSTPKRLKRMQVGSQTPTSKITFHPNEALALIVDSKLSKEGYLRIQRAAKKIKHNIFPSYKAVQAAKLKCYPEDIKKSEDGVEVQLQTLLDFTLDRLMLVHNDVFTQVKSKQLKVFCKWGFDGSGGHSIYKQNFSDSRLYGDTNIILCSVVIIQICDDYNNVYWKASSTSSTRFCRPLTFKLLKESQETVVQLNNEVETQINKLKSKSLKIDDMEIELQYIMLPTMFDGKIINILTNNKSSQCFFICKAKSTEMNDIKKVYKRTCATDTFKYGMSILHAYIRSMELFLHVSYKLDFKKWQARGEQQKESVQRRQKEISTKFYQEMGLVIDLPKQGGGNSNDGSTARRFFSSPELVARITGLDENLISRFSIILSTLASRYAIKTDKFKKYCFETANIYTSLYNWYYMSVTVHKVLIHGADIIKSQPLPIGTLSEDIQEARQKDFKNFRLFRARKTSRLNTNTDIFNLLLITSDPVISSLREKPKHRVVPFVKEVTDLFENPAIPGHQHIVVDSDDDDDDDDEDDDEDDDDDDNDNN